MTIEEIRALAEKVATGIAVCAGCDSTETWLCHKHQLARACLAMLPIVELASRYEEKDAQYEPDARYEGGRPPIVENARLDLVEAVRAMSAEMEKL